MAAIHLIETSSHFLEECGGFYLLFSKKLEAVDGIMSNAIYLKTN